MERVGFFVAGFASGWAIRTTVESSRSLAVKTIAAFYGVIDRTSRAAGMEREHFEDLLAEARAKYEEDRACKNRWQSAPPSAVAVKDRAA